MGEETLTPCSSKETPSPSRSPSPRSQQPGKETWLQFGQGPASAKNTDFELQRPLSGKPIPQAQVEMPVFPVAIPASGMELTKSKHQSCHLDLMNNVHCSSHFPAHS